MTESRLGHGMFFFLEKRLLYRITVWCGVLETSAAARCDWSVNASIILLILSQGAAFVCSFLQLNESSKSSDWTGLSGDLRLSEYLNEKMV